MPSIRGRARPDDIAQRLSSGITATARCRPACQDARDSVPRRYPTAREGQELRLGPLSQHCQPSSPGGCSFSNAVSGRSITRRGQASSLESQPRQQHGSQNSAHAGRSGAGEAKPGKALRAADELSEGFDCPLAGAGTSHMEDGCSGDIVDLPTVRTEPIAEIDLFLIEKVGFIEASDRREGGSTDGERSTEHPVNSPSAPFIAVRAEERSQT